MVPLESDTAGNQDVLFNATRYFRLLHVRAVMLMAKTPFEPQQNDSDELYLPIEVGALEARRAGFLTYLFGALLFFLRDEKERDEKEMRTKILATLLLTRDLYKPFCRASWS